MDTSVSISQLVTSQNIERTFLKKQWNAGKTIISKYHEIQKAEERKRQEAIKKAEMKKKREEEAKMKRNVSKPASAATLLQTKEQLMKRIKLDAAVIKAKLFFDEQSKRCALLEQ